PRPRRPAGASPDRVFGAGFRGRDVPVRRGAGDGSAERAPDPHGPWPRRVHDRLRARSPADGDREPLPSDQGTRSPLIRYVKSRHAPIAPMQSFADAGSDEGETNPSIDPATIRSGRTPRTWRTA